MFSTYVTKKRPSRKIASSVYRYNEGTNIPTDKLKNLSMKHQPILESRPPST